MAGPRDPGPTLVAPILLLVGGVLQLLLASFGVLVIVLCAAVAAASCLGISVVASLPLIAGAAAVALGVVTLVRPPFRRACGAVATGVSAGVIATGFGLFADYPRTLVFLLLAIAWPLFLILSAGAWMLAAPRAPPA